jgi:hypothetical protein
MSLQDILRKFPEALQVQPLTRVYRKEREKILQELKTTQPERVKSSGLESPSPFEYTAFLSSILHIANKIGPKILDYHLLSDDRSGRVPSLVLMNWQKRVEDAYGKDRDYSTQNPRIDFILGGARHYNSHKIEEFIRENQERLGSQPQLLVTDTIDEGSTLLKLLPLFDKYGISVDIATLSHHLPSKNYEDIVKGRKIYYGEILPSSLQDTSAGSTVIRRNSLGGITDPPETNKKYHPVRIAPEWRRRGMEILVREQAKDFAKQLPIPKIHA